MVVKGYEDARSNGYSIVGCKKIMSDMKDYLHDMFETAQSRWEHLVENRERLGIAYEAYQAECERLSNEMDRINEYLNVVEEASNLIHSIRHPISGRMRRKNAPTPEQELDRLLNEVMPKVWEIHSAIYSI